MKTTRESPPSPEERRVMLEKVNSGREFTTEDMELGEITSDIRWLEEKIATVIAGDREIWQTQQ